MVSTTAKPNPISRRRVALTLAVCTLALNWASLAASQEFAPPAAVDEWTEAGEFEAPVGPTDHDWEEEEDKNIKREMEDKSNSEDEDEDGHEDGDEDDKFMELSTDVPRCGKGCTDEKRHGKQAWGGKKGKCIMPGGKVGNLCKTCGPCRPKGGPKPTPAPAASAARRRRRRRRRSAPAAAPTSAPPGKKLVWSDEFDDESCVEGRPGKAWGYEEGFVRNDEHQWYQKDNARCVNGKLVITSGKHAPRTRRNPNFKRGSNDWKTSREHITYTSSAIQTKGKKDFGH